MKIILIVFWFYAVTSKDACANDHAGKMAMNGIEYSKYRNFDKKWKLVTVRYRKDTEEMRFTYANPLAYRTLLSGKKDFPDGAVFGKIGVKTSPDEIFESSVAPLGARRFQLMVRDKNKYKAQSGWGYALFDERGLTFPDEPIAQVNACASCHEVAQPRGYVFSELVNLSARDNRTTWVNKHLPINSYLNFVMEKRENILPKIMEIIPEKFTFVRLLKGTMTKAVFQGTLDEIRPTLSKETFHSKLPSILISDDQKSFSIVIPEHLGTACNLNEKQGVFMKSLISRDNEEIAQLDFCYVP